MLVFSKTIDHLLSGCLSSAIFLVLCGYFGTTTVSAVLLLTLAVGVNGLSIAGYGVNHLDISPRYAGILMGLSNSFATLPGILGPAVAKAIAKEASMQHLGIFLS